MKIKIIALTALGIVITALFLGGYFLSKNNEVKSTSNEKKEVSNEVIDYTQLIEQSEGENEQEEINEYEVEKTNEKESKEIEKAVMNEVKKVLEDEETDDHHSHDYEAPQTIYDMYEGKYSKKQIEKAINRTYDFFYLLTDTTYNDEKVIDKWKKITTDNLFKKFEKGEKELFSFLGYKEMEIVTVESDYDGLALGLFVATQENVTLVELDFEVKGNSVLIDEFHIVWSS